MASFDNNMPPSTDCSASMLFGGVRSNVESESPGPPGKSITLILTLPYPAAPPSPSCSGRVRQFLGPGRRTATWPVDKVVDNLCDLRWSHVGTLGTSLWTSTISPAETPADQGP